MPIQRSGPPLLGTQIYFARSPTPQECEDGQPAHQTLPGTILPQTFDIFCHSPARGITGGEMATVCLDNQVFYNPNPPVAVGPGPASRGLLVQKRDSSSPAPFLSPPPPQDTYDSQHGGAGKSQDNAILIPSDVESDDDLDDGRSDTSFESLGGLLLDARNKVKSGSVTSTGTCLDLAFLGRPNTLTYLSRQRCRHCSRR